MSNPERDPTSRLQSAVLRIEEIIGNRAVPDGCGIKIIHAPNPDDPNIDFKNFLITLADTSRGDGLSAMKNPSKIVLKDTFFDESLFRVIEEILSNDGQRQDYVELAGAIANAKRALFDLYRASLTRKSELP